MAIQETDLQRARAAIVSVAAKYLPDLKKTGVEYEACCPFHAEKSPSFKINEQKEFFHCFGCGANGNAIDFVMRITGCDFQAAVSDIIGGIVQDTAPKIKPPPEPWVQEGAAPAGTPDPDFIHPIHGAPVAVYRYQAASGETIGFTCRFDKPNGKKEILPLTWCHNKETGHYRYRWKGFSAPRPLYRLTEITRRPSSPILIVEGEKTADAAAAIFPGYNVLTWSGGGGAVSKSDWSPLAGRSVAIWPDGDEPGEKAARAIWETVRDMASQVRIVPAPFPDGWDLADEPPEPAWLPTTWARENATLASAYFQQPEIIPADPLTGAIERIIPAPDSVDWYSPLPDTVGEARKPIATIDNLAEICRRVNLTIRYNVISKEVEIIVPHHHFTVDNQADASIAWLQSMCAKFRYPVGNLLGYIGFLADQNLYNPVATWIESKPWDGISRVPDLMDTITTHPEAETLKRALMRRWLISAVAAAFLPSGVSAHGLLVLQGEQNLGKTAWFKSLAPAEMAVIRDGMMLRPDNPDSVKQAVANWMVELGELDATFRRADIAQLKAFLTRDSDVLRRPYAKAESHYARRTVFFGSVNPAQYLQDDTGNRRYWTIAATAINYEHGIDMQQVWAEIYETEFLPWYQTARNTRWPWLLSPDELLALNTSNEQFQAADPIHERILTMYDWQLDPQFWEWHTATDILAAIGYDRPTRGDVTHCGIVMRKLNGGLSRRSSGKNLIAIPPKLLAG